MATRKEISEAFIAAKKLTARNRRESLFAKSKKRYEFICHALAATNLPGAEAAAKIIRVRFASRHSTIYSWLSEQGISIYLLSDDNVQAYKHRWLDSVIKEFSA